MECSDPQSSTNGTTKTRLAVLQANSALAAALEICHLGAPVLECATAIPSASTQALSTPLQVRENDVNNQIPILCNPLALHASKRQVSVKPIWAFAEGLQSRSHITLTSRHLCCSVLQPHAARTAPALLSGPNLSEQN